MKNGLCVRAKAAKKRNTKTKVAKCQIHLRTNVIKEQTARASRLSLFHVVLMSGTGSPKESSVSAITGIDV